MSDPAFVHEDVLDTTPSRLWAALTSGEITRRYWFDRRVESDWTVGSVVRFYDGDSDRVTDSGEVLEVDPTRRLVYSFRQEASDGGPASPATRVSFELRPLPGGKVRYRLVHDGLAGAEDVESWREGWTPILANLREYLAGHGATA
ncbi:ATPase [Actinoalloteichus sp. AHMU CJ021]|uniref:Conserved protein YndB, AHSA1/START domain n=1 Tax=Actinoalloteichus caeruleus DSM 43889 TaxID=1120930 RepID=A0ABT1JB86_ACTCY|nr:SRPBCC domain-containing protein [Actinoalloteichus caeruleus]AUS79478.1 ATPase [Actinoalloteichus sp. AHMU CJ021]MCP2329765.1 putative conserved protein YndB, AHSA1/START domain [Actinoalloteichus caeruleus DSM 43889]